VRGRGLWVAVLGWTVAAAVACRPPAPRPAGATGDWLLVHPPEIADAAAPGGLWLEPKQPIERWRTTGRFPTEQACDAARRPRIDETISAARKRVGVQARYDPDVRRAVNACCVRAGVTGDPRVQCHRDGAPLTPP